MDPDDHGYYVEEIDGDILAIAHCIMQVPVAYAPRIPEFLNDLDADLSDDRSVSLNLSVENPTEYKVLPFNDEHADDPEHVWVSFQGRIDGHISGCGVGIDEIDADYLGIDWTEDEECIPGAVDDKKDYLYIEVTTEDPVDILDWSSEVYWTD